MEPNLMVVGENSKNNAWLLERTPTTTGRYIK